MLGPSSRSACLVGDALSGPKLFSLVVFPAIRSAFGFGEPAQLDLVGESLEGDENESLGGPEAVAEGGISPGGSHLLIHGRRFPGSWGHGPCDPS